MASSSPAQRSRSERLAMYESAGRSSTAYLSLSPDLDCIFREGEGFLAFKEHLGVRVAPGDPVSLPGGLDGIARDVTHGTPRGSQFVLFACDDTTRRVFEGHGFSSLHIGSEPVVDIGSFSMSGRRNRGIRGSMNRARRGGLRVTPYMPASGRDGATESWLRRVSKAWCATKGTPELNFLVGRLDFEETYGKTYFLCQRGRDILAYLLFYTMPATGDVYLDHMRRLPGSPKECLDFTLCEAIEAFKALNVGRMFMGVCPFSRMSEADGVNPDYLNDLFTMLRRPFAFLYPAEGEYNYKRKYATSWEPRYMCAYPRVSTRGLLAILECFCPGGLAAIAYHRLGRFRAGRSARAR